MLDDDGALLPPDGDEDRQLGLVLVHASANLRVVTGEGRWKRLESAVLLKEDYDTRALEQNLGALTRFPEAFAWGFDRLPFHVRRQIVMAVVESIEVVDRQELRVRFSIRFDNAGISQLTDEVVAAVTRGGAMPEAADECKGDADGFVGRRGTEWLPGGGVRGNLGDRPGGVGAGEA